MPQTILNLNTVIFDWSGTLYDDHQPSYLATVKTLEMLADIHITHKDYRQYFSIPVTRFYKRYGIHKPLAEINKIYFDVYADYYFKGKLFAGVKHLLNYLHSQEIKIGIFSTLRQSYIVELLKKYKLAKYVTWIKGDVNNKIQELPRWLRQHNINPKSSLYIGDMDHDVLAAHKAKVWAGAVLSGYHDALQVLSAKPRLVWQSVNDVLTFFKSLPVKTKKFSWPKWPLTTVGVLVQHQNKYLFVLTPKWNYGYGIVGGKIEAGEAITHAAKREVFEETGLNVKLKNTTYVDEHIYSIEFYNLKAHFILINKVGVSKSNRVKLNDEAVAYLWLTLDEAKFLPLNAPTKRLLQKMKAT